MASHPNYPQQGPGPSYYQQPPLPHHVYGSHSPQPRTNYYAYPAPPPPHMNSHQPAQYHPQASSRGNHRGGSMNGYNSSRATHHYHNYHPAQQQSPYQHTHVAPALGIHPPQHQHAGQHMPYSPQSAKYNQPYSPAYSGYPSVTAPVFTPSWQTQHQQQPISPLPKQLSMPPPQNINTGFYEPSVPPHPPSVLETPQIPITQEQIQFTQQSTFSEETKIEEWPAAPNDSTLSPSSSPPPPDSLNIEEASTAQSSSSYSQMGTILTSESAELNSSSSPDLTSSSSQRRGLGAKWAIWSRRPQDPSHAPGIIISPRARPPPDIVEQALDVKTPPVTVPSSPAVLSKKILPSSQEISVMPSSENKGSLSPSLSLDETGTQTIYNSSVPSSSVTETTGTPTISGSPASSHTSLSVLGTPPKDVDGVNVHRGKDASGEADTPAPVLIESAVSEITTTSTVSVILADNVTSAVQEKEKLEAPASPSIATTTPTPDMLASPSPAVVPTLPTTATPQASTPSAAATTTPVPAPAPPAFKKSWASLLRPATSPSPASGPTTARNALPTSSVVGFSIPAAPLKEIAPPVPVSAGKKNELINLLSVGLGAALGGPSYLKIRPRGLINSGNMCFANSVLQILVYCPPFHQLFVELGNLLTTGSTINRKESPSPGSGKDGDAKANNDSATPLVDATVEFLKEFVEDKKSTKEKNRNVYIGIGSSGSGSGRGKGKEREIVESDEDDKQRDDDWDGDSFMPTGIYDAMKVKKRFENMRGGHQEDAEEFLGFYLDTLEEELLSILHTVNPPKQTGKGATDAHVEEKEEAAPPEDDGWLEVGKKNRSVITRTIKTTESPISRIFGGKFRSTLRTPGQKDSSIVEDWQSLRLDIQREQIHTIQEALSYISHPQTVQIPQKSGATVEAHQQVLIESLPQILVLHIKRFYYDTSANGVVKVSKQVRFGPELEIGSDVMVPAARKAHPKYKLFAAIYHHGLSASGGHYTLDVLHPNRYPSSNPASKPKESWVRIDDNLVSDVRHEDVFGAWEKDESRCAYLLFYKRV